VPRVARLLLLISLTIAGLAAGLIVSAQGVPGPSGAGEPQPPEVNAGKYVILSDFNEVLHEQNAHERTPPASLTKMMTAVVAVRYMDLNAVVTIHQEDLVGEATMGLVAGDQVTIGDLMYGLLLPSGNDAAMAIARGTGLALGAGDNESAVQEFVRLMNVTALQFQLRDTHFMNPHGLDQEGHYSSAYDLAIILRAALNYPQITERMQTLAIRVGERYDLYNGNHLLTDRSDYIGGKTGLTDGCGFCLAGAARDESGRTVIAVALDDDWSWFWDVSLLLDYGFELERQHGVPVWADPTLVGSQFAQVPNPTSGAVKSGGQ
jgi:D-alanyl-D-alanine carboxypeptidase (penicillin-binding protein 5/6)